MASSTIQLQRTINYAQQFLRLSPLTFTLNTANDPAFSNADWVKQFILSPPFAWRWNRAGSSDYTTPTFTTQAGKTDYTVSLPTFGWLEKATSYEIDNAYFPHELQVGLNLASDNTTNQPARISTQYDDGQGNQAFRIFPAPEKPYAVCLEYQNAATLFTLLTQTWAPIPDYLSYLFNTGFQAKGYEYTNDPRFISTMQLFMQQLAAASEGLSESQKNLWLTDRLNSMRETSAVQQGKR